MLETTDLNRDRRLGLEKLARENHCAECGGILVVRWLGHVRGGIHALTCGKDINHEGIKKGLPKSAEMQRRIKGLKKE